MISIVSALVIWLLIMQMSAASPSVNAASDNAAPPLVLRVVLRFVPHHYFFIFVVYRLPRRPSASCELAIASVKALTRPTQPDTEDIDESHDRIAAGMAAPFQTEAVLEHYESIASDAQIARVVQQEERKHRKSVVPDERAMPAKGADMEGNTNSMEFGHMSPLVNYRNHHAYSYPVGTKIRCTEPGGKVFWKCRVVDVEQDNGYESV